MNAKNIFLLSCAFMLVIGIEPVVCLAREATSYPPNAKPNVVEKRISQEEDDNDFLINFHEPNYIFPFYHSSSLPHDFYYALNKEPKRTEVSFQVSFKVPVKKDLFHSHTNLYLAYTQKSFWQAYENLAYMRETTYTPEIFLSKLINDSMFLGWKMKCLNLGALHQSNGRGETGERAWDRLYLASVFSKDNWMVTLKPWYVINDKSKREYNPDISHYLGYDSLLIAYKYGTQVFSAERTNLESGIKRGSLALTWSVPLTKKLKFYTEFFGGYGQSLTEYNHSVTSVGIGIALNDWI